MFDRYPIKIYSEKDAFEYTYSTVRVFVMYYDVVMQIPMIKNIANRQGGTAGVLVINKCSGLDSLRRDKLFYYFIKRVFRNTFYRTLTFEYHYLYGILHRLEDFALYRKKVPRTRTLQRIWDELLKRHYKLLGVPNCGLLAPNPRCT